MIAKVVSLFGVRGASEVAQEPRGEADAHPVLPQPLPSARAETCPDKVRESWLHKVAKAMREELDAERAEALADMEDEIRRLRQVNAELVEELRRRGA